MKTQKTISLAVIATQLVFVCSAMAAAGTATPEFTLVQNSIALAGQNLSQEELQSRISKVFANYEKTAEPDGQTQRMEDALVAMNVYEPEQAHQLVLDAQSFSPTGAATDSKSLTQSVSNEMALLVSKYPSGAQFSACDLSGVLAIGGFFTGIAGGIVWSLGADATCGPYGADCRNQTEVKTGIIITASAVLAMVDALVVYEFSSDCKN